MVVIDLTSESAKSAIQSIVDSHEKAQEDSKKKLSEYCCPICLDTPKDVTAAICGHMFCNECLYRSFVSSANHISCPICRRKITKNQLVRLEMKVGKKIVHLIE